MEALMKIKSSALAALLFLLPNFFASNLLHAQKVTSFEGLDAIDIEGPTFEIDANGSVGTLQYMEWVNSYYQAYSKTSPFTPVWSTPQVADTPWVTAGMTNCYGTGGGEGTITFDKLASKWVIARRAGPSANVYYWCIAISNTADLTSPSLAWYTYQFNISANLGLNAKGNTYYPDYPRFGVWQDGYYATFDLEDPNNQYQEIGVLACVFDRTNMIINGTPRAFQCFSNPSPIPTSGALYLAHSLMPADIDGTTAPKTGQDEYMISIENPPNDGSSTTSTTLNLWQFKTNWTTPSKSTFTKSSLTVPTYEPGCYVASDPANTFCVPEPSSKSTGYYVDSIGDRMVPRLSFRNQGTYSSFLIAHTVQVGTGTSQQTGIRWYELRGTGKPTLYQNGTVSAGTSIYRFVPSMAQDASANAAVGYSASSTGLHPGIRASTFSLTATPTPKEITLEAGVGDEEDSEHWGNITSMSVDPTDNCTFWFVDEYFQANQITGYDWDTRIANFHVTGCVAKR
jgi:hypothetical protein